jgi:hypothetical protein
LKTEHDVPADKLPIRKRYESGSGSVSQRYGYGYGSGSFPFSHKDVDHTEIMLAKKKFEHKIYRYSSRLKTEDNVPADML